MRALVFDGELRVADAPEPSLAPGEVLIKVGLAGICNTDHEIVRGYVPGFDGVLGHEFVGTVEEAEDLALVGQRATAEINVACGTCPFCREGLGRHCTNRSVLGIMDRDGVFADYVRVPSDNVVPIPESIPDRRAVFIEPLAAACEILTQVEVLPEAEVLLLGDGKLAQLIALVLSRIGCRLRGVGKHPAKLQLMHSLGVREPLLLGDYVPRKHDLVVEATGSPDALELAVASTRARGTIVLKSTYAMPAPFNPAPLVVDEITLVGSRCGLFDDAISFLMRWQPPLERLITAEYPVEQGREAFQRSAQPDSLKVLLNFDE